MKAPIAASPLARPSRRPGSREAASLDSRPLTRLGARLAAGLAGVCLRSPRRLGTERPIVTFSFDGASRNSYLLGAALVERAGGRAVFYIETGDAGQRDAARRRVEPGDIRDLHLRGHEVALHGHRAAGAPDPAPQRLDHDIPRNRAALRAIHPGIAAENFAYPAGLSSLAQKAAVSGLTASSRGSRAGVNGRVFDSQWLRSVPLDGSLGAGDLAAHLDRAERLRGWIIFSMREISHAAGEGACSPRQLKAALDACLARGFEIRTVAQALQRSRPATLFCGLRAPRGAATSLFASQDAAAEPGSRPLAEGSGGRPA